MPSPTPNAPAVALARLAVVTGANDRTGESVTVHFNPATLGLQLSNQLKNTANNERKQYVARTSATLSMDLLFDTTDTGEDVTRTTRRLQAFLAPPLPEGDRARQSVPPPLVLFEWGTLRFKGIAETYRETIDFFSADGVPLRSSVALTLSRQDQVFDDPGPAPAAGAADDALALDTDAASAADLAGRTDRPDAARALGAANGQESLRFGAGAALQVRAGATLRAPAAFASGAASGAASFGASAGGAASAGVEGAVGMAPLARLTASEGAFAGLRAAPPSAVRLPSGGLGPAPDAARAADVGAPFRAGGAAGATGPAGLSADVGARSRLTFDRS